MESTIPFEVICLVTLTSTIFLLLAVRVLSLFKGVRR
jgi:hypothetical protein